MKQSLIFADDVVFSTPSPRPKEFKCCYLCGSGTFYNIRIYLGGADRGFGCFPASRLADAARFADMVRLFFAKYRRGAKQLVDADFNSGSLAQVQTDLNVETHIVEMLSGVETTLVNLGELKLPSAPAPRKISIEMRLQKIENLLERLLDVLAAK